MSFRRCRRRASAAWILGVCGGLLGTAACGGGSSALPGPTPTPILETFSGSVEPGGSVFHTFTVARAGNLDVTLTEAGPPATIYMGIAVGNVSGGQCVPAVGGAIQAQAGTTAQIYGAAGVGDYCVLIFDVGNQAAAVAYSVTVTHL